MSHQDNHKPWVPPCCPKQLELIAKCAPHPNRKKYHLVSGPRRSGKTLACLHAIALNLWETDHAYISMVVPTMTTAVDGGPWVMMTKSIIPTWIDAGFGMEWVTPPRTEGVSKKPYFQVTNKYGTASRLQLDSLQNEREVEDRFKGRVFTMVYMSELSFFKQRKTFDIIQETLRTPHLPSWSHLLLADTNPADAGRLSWIYKLWYEQRIKDNPSPEEKPLISQLELSEFFVNDNAYLTEEDKLLLRSQYIHSKDLTDRYLNGLWVAATTDSVFNEVLRPDYHFIGDPPTADDPFPDQLIPEENCISLLAGWDLGNTNSAAVILEPIRMMVEGREVVGFKQLDELVKIGEQFSVAEFTEDFMEKMAFWEGQCGRKVIWTHVSDSSAFDRRESISQRAQVQEVHAVSGGRINMIAAEKGMGSLRARVDLLKRLLFQGRYFVNRSCQHTIEMLQSIPPGKNGAAVPRDSRFKHSMDAATYAMQHVCYDELQQAVFGVKIGNSQDQLISLG